MGRCKPFFQAASWHWIEAAGRDDLAMVQELLSHGACPLGLDRARGPMPTSRQRSFVLGGIKYEPVQGRDASDPASHSAWLLERGTGRQCTSRVSLLQSLEGTLTSPCCHAFSFLLLQGPCKVAPKCIVHNVGDVRSCLKGNKSFFNPQINWPSVGFSFTIWFGL